MDILSDALVEQLLAQKGQPIPADLCDAFSPAEYYLYEWDENWLECTGANRLRVGAGWIEPRARDLFCTGFAAFG